MPSDRSLEASNVCWIFLFLIGKIKTRNRALCSQGQCQNSDAIETKRATKAMCRGFGCQMLGRNRQEYIVSSKTEPYVDLATIVLLVILNTVLITLLLYWLYRKKGSLEKYLKKIYLKGRASRFSRGPANLVRKLGHKLKAKSRRSTGSPDSRDSKRSRGSKDSHGSRGSGHRKRRSKSRSRSKSKSKSRSRSRGESKQASLKSLPQKAQTPHPKFLANPDIVTALKRVEALDQAPGHQLAQPLAQPQSHPLVHPPTHSPAVKQAEAPIISAFTPIPTDMKTTFPMSENFSDFRLQTATVVLPAKESQQTEAPTSFLSTNFPQQSVGANAPAMPVPNLLPTMSAAIPPISGTVPNPSTKTFADSNLPDAQAQADHHVPRPNEQKAIHPSMVSEQIGRPVETINLISQNPEPSKTKDGKDGLSYFIP